MSHPNLPTPPTSSRSLPLDPTSESRYLQSQYAASRVARLRAVREASRAEAAEKRAQFLARQKAKELKERREMEAREEYRMEMEKAAMQQRLITAQRAFGEAQRASAALAEQKLVEEEMARSRKQELEEHTQERFQKAITIVQQKNEAPLVKRQQLLETKLKIKQAQEENRAKLELQEKAFLERHPPHMREWRKMAFPPTPSQVTLLTPSPVNHHCGPMKKQSLLKVPSPAGHGSIPGGLSPATPALSSVASTPDIAAIRMEEQDEPASDMLRPVPTPHPHPSTRKRAASATPRTPAEPVAVALNFTSPSDADAIIHVEDEDKENRIPFKTVTQVKKEANRHDQLHASSIPAIPQHRVPLGSLSQDEVKQRDVLVFHQTHLSHAEQQRLTRKTTNVTADTVQQRKRQQKAFEIVIKQQGQIVRQPIIAATPAIEESPQEIKPAMDTVSTKQLKKITSTQTALKTNRRRRPAVSVIPILTPNAAFFQQPALTQSSNMFNPEIRTGSKAVAWVIPTDLQVTPTRPIVESLSAATNGPSNPIIDATISPQSENAPILRGLQLAQAHQAKRAAQPIKPVDPILTVEKENIQIEIGDRYFAQSTVASVEIIQQEQQQNEAPTATPPATELIAQDELTQPTPIKILPPPAMTAPPQPTPSITIVAPTSSQTSDKTVPHPPATPSITTVAPSPAAPVVFKRTLTDQEFIAAATAAMRKQQATPAAAPDRLTALSTPGQDSQLNQQLDQILQRHLYQDAQLSAPTQLIFSPQTQPTRRATQEEEDSDGDSDFDRSSLTSLTPMTPAQLLAKPTAVTDLFIESINYFIEQERLAAEKADQELLELMTPTPKMKQSHTQQSDGILKMRELDLRGSLTQNRNQIREEEDGKPLKMIPPPQFASPTTHVYAQHSIDSVTSTPSTYSNFQTPAKFSVDSVSGSPANLIPPPSTDRKVLLQTFQHMTDAEFQQAQPVKVIHVPVPVYTPSANSTPYLMSPATSSGLQSQLVTPQRPSMQQRFEQRMGM